MSVTHIYIFMALALYPYKYLRGKFCLSCLKRLSLASCLRIYNIVEHNDRMLPCIIVLYILLTTGVTTDFKNSCLVTQIKLLTIHRLYDKMFTFVRHYIGSVVKKGN